MPIQYINVGDLVILLPEFFAVEGKVNEKLYEVIEIQGDRVLLRDGRDSNVERWANMNDLELSFSLSDNGDEGMQF